MTYFLPFQLGYELKEDEVESVFQNFKAMAEKKKVNNYFYFFF